MNEIYIAPAMPPAAQSQPWQAWQPPAYQAQAYQPAAWQGQYHPPAPTYQPAACRPPAPVWEEPEWDDTDDHALETVARLSDELARFAREEAPPITDQQLRALGKRHLILMLRDQEKELQQLKREKQELLLAYLAGLRC
ncbi:MAG: hypothetical protein FWH26_06015 [Oscillospiraceae bacterium]|nr:hypothetical protein [Oscillospiraceae bacterium]